MSSRAFKCEACNSSYKQKRNLLNHLRNHFEKFICEYCSLQFTSEKLHQHIVSVHEPHRKEYSYSCRFCVRKFPSAIFRNSHERDVHKGRDKSAFKCPECDIIFIKKDQLRLHNLENHHNGLLFFCPFTDCDRCFKTQKLLKIHEKIHGAASYQCKLCKKTFKQSSNCSKHKRRCKGLSNQKEYTADELSEMSEIARKQYDEIFGKFKELKGKNDKTEDEPMKILYLEEFEKEVKENLEIKIDKTHKVKKKFVQRNVQEEIQEKSSEKILICDKCAMQFDSRRNFRKHQRMCLEEKIIDIPEPPKNDISINSKNLKINEIFKCSEFTCNAVFKNRGNLYKHVQHILLNKRSFQCDKCAKFFKTKYHLKIHLKTHEIPKKCPICSIYLPNIEAHIKRHSKPKQSSFICQQCNRQCATKQALLEHVQRIHDRKPLGKFYRCPICRENFIRNSDLRRHSFLHYQGKVYCCTYPGCTDMFKTSYKLQLHQVIHNSSNEKIFICEICNKSFSRQTSLYKHKKLHLKTKISLKNSC